MECMVETAATLLFWQNMERRSSQCAISRTEFWVYQLMELSAINITKDQCCIHPAEEFTGRLHIPCKPHEKTYYHEGKSLFQRTRYMGTARCERWLGS